MSDTNSWRVFRGDGVPRSATLPQAPPWRRVSARARAAKPPPYLIDDKQADVVNAALHLRRPLLVTGRPGSGKSTLADAIASELGLGPVLRWRINSRSQLSEALYRYDAVGRLREHALDNADAAGREVDVDDERGIGSFIRLGPVGTALAAEPGAPRVLLIDELDKSDIDLPNDLLSVFEDGEFEIPELARLPEDQAEISVMVTGSRTTVAVKHGVVRCEEFPVIVITSNGERDFPPAFLRRCVRLDLPRVEPSRLEQIVKAHLGDDALESEAARSLVTTFLERQNLGELATDQLLNAIHLRLTGVDMDLKELTRSVLHRLDGVTER